MTLEEKLYYVLDKQGKTLLMNFMDVKVCSSGGYEVHDGNKYMYQLTEKQIKDYDERYFAFAVPVEVAE